MTRQSSLLFPLAVAGVAYIAALLLSIYFGLKRTLERERRQ